MIAKDLLRMRFAACVNILQVVSFYRWRVKTKKGREWMIRTNSKVFPKVKQRILALHSYEMPEVVSLKIDSGSRPYVAWMDGALLS